MGGVLKPLPLWYYSKINAENRESTCLHIYAVVYVTVIRLAHAIVNLNTSTFIFTIMAEMIFAQETSIEKLIACLQSPYILVHVYMQENEGHCRRSTSTCKKFKLYLYFG